MRDEQAIEAEIQAKGLNAPRFIMPAMIDATIPSLSSSTYSRAPTMTVCCLALKNGFQVIGESAAASSSELQRRDWAEDCSRQCPQQDLGA